MKRFLTLVLLFCLLINGLFAQEKTENRRDTTITIESGISLKHTTRDRFPIPLNFELQKRAEKWGWGASLSIQYDRKSWGDCNKRFAVGTFLDWSIEIRNPSNVLRAYCESFHYLSVKPTVFGSCYFLEKKKWNMFVKIGLLANLDIEEWIKGDYFEIENNTISSSFVKVIKSEPVRVVQKTPLFQLNNIGFLSGLGCNYFLNEKTAIRFTVQPELNTSLFIKTYNKGYLIFVLGGLSFKI